MLKIIVLLAAVACVSAGPVSRCKKKSQGIPPIPSVVTQLLDFYKQALAQKFAAPTAPVRYLVASSPSFVTQHIPEPFAPRNEQQPDDYYKEQIKIKTKCPCKASKARLNYAENIPYDVWQTPPHQPNSYKQNGPKRTLCQIAATKNLPPALNNYDSTRELPQQNYEMARGSNQQQYDPSIQWSNQPNYQMSQGLNQHSDPSSRVSNQPHYQKFQELNKKNYPSIQWPNEPNYQTSQGSHQQNYPSMPVSNQLNYQNPQNLNQQNYQSIPVSNQQNYQKDQDLNKQKYASNYQGHNQPIYQHTQDNNQQNYQKDQGLNKQKYALNHQGNNQPIYQRTQNNQYDYSSIPGSNRPNYQPIQGNKQIGDLSLPKNQVEVPSQTGQSQFTEEETVKKVKPAPVLERSTNAS